MTDETASAQKAGKENSVFPAQQVKPVPEAGNDPLRIMIEIAENEKLSDQDKTALILYAKTRFSNRRRMAYVALYTIVASLAVLFGAAFIDGFLCPSCNILESIEKNQTLIASIEGFLTAIVAAYYGASAWRPAS